MMKPIIVFMLLSSSAQAALIPGGDSSTIGGRLSVITPKHITLICAVGAGGTGNCSFVDVNHASPSAGYQVPVSKIYREVSMHCINTTPSAASIAIGYADNDLGYGTATAQVNYVGIAGRPPGPIFSIPTGSASPTLDFNFGSGFIIPTGKYPFLIGDGTANVICTLYGTQE